MRATTFERCRRSSFQCYDFDGCWYDSFGKPATNAAWFIYAPSGSGKTSFMVQLAYYMSRFCKVGYISAEEGDSLSFKLAITRNQPENSKYCISLFSNPASYQDICLTIENEKRIKFWIIDSIDYMRLTTTQIKSLLDVYSDPDLKNRNKSFAMVGFAEGNKPQTAAGNYMKYAASIKVFIRDFVAEGINSRYGGNRQPFVINKALADERRGGGRIWDEQCIIHNA